MTQETSGMTVTAVMQNPSFLDDKIDLTKLSKKLSKISDEVIDTLIALLQSKDERTRMTVAIKLLELDIDVKKVISQDQMQRLIAEIKLNRSGGPKQIPVHGEDSRPLVDFSTVRTF
jgi:hypothetical protein